METTVEPTRATVSGPQSSRAHYNLPKKWDSCLQHPGQALEQPKAQAEVVT